MRGEPEMGKEEEGAGSGKLLSSLPLVPPSLPPSLESVSAIAERTPR